MTMKKIKLIIKESKKKLLKEDKGTAKKAKAKMIKMVKSGKWPFPINHEISGTIKYSSNYFSYDLEIDGEKFSGESQNGGRSLAMQDMGPVSMSISRNHENFPRDIHEPAMQYAWAKGDISVFEVNNVS